jgi:tight adherence protein C
MSFSLESFLPLIMAGYFAALFLAFWTCLNLYASSLRARQRQESSLTRYAAEQRRSVLFRIAPYLGRIVRVVEKSGPGRKWMQAARRDWAKPLLQAGLADQLAGDGLIALKLVAPLGVLVVLLVFSVNQREVLVMAMGLGYFLPNLWVRDRIRSRSTRIARSLPDTLDTISLMLQAGLGFSQALDIYAETAEQSPLASEIVLAGKQMRLGRTRADVLETMSSRADCLPLTHFTMAIIQAERLGTSIGEALLAQAAEMRTRRFQKAEEMGQKATVKMLGPLLLLVLPNVFIVLFAPMLLQMLGY